MVLRQRLMEQMESRMQVEDEELRDLIDMAILEAAEGAYLPLKERLSLRKELFDSFRRLDILQELVDDPTITEIMVNGAEHIFVERQGRVEELEKHFDSVGQLEDLIQQIVSRVNRTVNLASPIADARLEDGSRVHVVLAPVALNGPILTIRKFPEPITMERLIELKSISREAAAFLQKAVEQGLNIFISGGTGSGKTTILNAMSGYIPQEERIITIEDSAELQIRHVKNLVSLETRVENRDGSQEISMRDLIRASLRMRPEGIKIKKGKLKRKKKRIPIPHTFLQYILGNLIPLIRCEVVKIIEEADDLLSFFHSILHVESILPINGICTQHSFPE